MCGVFMYGWPEALVSSKRRSSIRITIRLGFLAISRAASGGQPPMATPASPSALPDSTRPFPAPFMSSALATIISTPTPVEWNRWPSALSRP